MTEKRVAWVLGAGFSKPLSVPLARELFDQHQLALAAEHIQKCIVPREAVTFLDNACGDRDGPEFAARHYLQILAGLDRCCDLLTNVGSSLAARVGRLIDDMDGGRRVMATNSPRSRVRPLPKRAHPDHELLTILRATADMGHFLNSAPQRLSDLRVDLGISVEQILWQLERASAGEPEAIATTSTGSGEDAAKLYIAAKRLIVAQIEYACGLRQDVRWRPYERFASSLLRDEDTIITFNYDRVVELALSRVGGAPFQRLHKMHGGLAGDEISKYALWLRGYPGGSEPALGLPGASKDESPNDSDWQTAEQAISSADAVAIIGYSFPPDDIRSIELLIKGMASNPRKGVGVPMKVVLGDDFGNVARIRSMVGHRVDSRSGVSAFTAESLLGWQRDDLFRQ
ncbi:MAG: hypothetical protein AAGF92_17730 [Myxococcota bacterium]